MDNKGLSVWVLKDAAGGDCSANGVTARYDKFVLVGEGVPGIFPITSDTPGLRLERRELFGEKGSHHWVARPIDDEDLGIGMFGGNWIHSSDSRFPSLGNHPIPVHDRYEGPNYTYPNVPTPVAEQKPEVARR